MPEPQPHHESPNDFELATMLAGLRYNQGGSSRGGGDGLWGAGAFPNNSSRWTGASEARAAKTPRKTSVSVGSDAAVRTNAARAEAQRPSAAQPPYSSPAFPTYDYQQIPECTPLMHGLEFGLNLSGGHSPVARIPEQMQARLQVPSLGGQRIIFWAGRFDTIDGLCEKVANKWPGPPQIQPQASDLRLFCSGKELDRNATAEDVGLFFIHLEVEVVVALEAVAGGARPLSACVGAAFAAGGGPRAEEVDAAVHVARVVASHAPPSRGLPPQHTPPPLDAPPPQNVSAVTHAPYEAA
jgi:hypothetical protein